MLPRAVDFDVIERGLQLFAQVISHSGEMGSFGGHLLAGDFAGFAKTDDAGHVQGAGTHAALVASAVDLRGNLHTRIAAANVERAYALGAIELMSRERHDVDVHLIHVDGDLTQGLNAIGMEDNALFVAKLSNFFNRLDDADLVI